jgi:hypothetical protein
VPNPKPSSSKEVAVTVCLNILNPLETFTPRTCEAALMALSAKSIRLRTHALSAADCDQLVETKLVSKIELESPVLDEPLVLKAMIFWAKHVVVDDKTPAYADLGFNFRPPNADDQPRLDKLLESLK